MRESGSHHRHAMRLPGYDYGQAGAYFVTICTQGRECLFGEVTPAGEMALNQAGRMVERWWQELGVKFPHVVTDAFVVMPNHVHGIIVITDPGADMPRGGHMARGGHIGPPLPPMGDAPPDGDVSPDGDVGADLCVGPGGGNVPSDGDVPPDGDVGADVPAKVARVGPGRGNIPPDGDAPPDGDVSPDRDVGADLRVGPGRAGLARAGLARAGADMTGRTYIDRRADMPRGGHIGPPLPPMGDAPPDGDVGDAPPMGDAAPGGNAPAGAPLPEIMQWFKTMTTNAYIRGVNAEGWPAFPGKLWQRSYYDHIIRDEAALDRIRGYIGANPLRWAFDRENPVAYPAE